jgi:hypothetical protein
VTNRQSPRAGGPSTVRLDDQPLPDRETAFYTPRSGDWLLLAVLVVALLGIGIRVWAQLGWGDQIGRAVFAGLALMALYWFALVFTFKLSLAIRVGPQGLAIVRGPWRVELRWSEITRLMERPQTVGGRRYRWVVALARDGRRIQVREDALLDYERFRREVYERYRLWRDHGGTWGATGGGPYVARESAGEEMRWWAVASLLIALPGLYCALLLPVSGARIAGYALLALALLCVYQVAATAAQRRTYALDGKMIEARGLLERTRLTWRDVSKVERTRHPAGGVILALVAVGRFILRVGARGDNGVRGFAWSPRVPEYLTLRGGGRQARIRLHHLAQPEELAAWVEFYTGVRKGGASHPLEAAAQTAPRRGAVSSGPAAARATQSAPLSGSGRRSRPDLSGASGPLDPWGGEREGELEGEAVVADFGAPYDLARESEPSHAPMPEPLFRGAPLSASFREARNLDQPPATVEPEAGRSDEAWLRETSALFSMNNANSPHTTPPPGAAPPTTPRTAQPSQTPHAPSAMDPAANAGYGAPQPSSRPAPARTSRQFVPPPGPRRSTVAPGAPGTPPLRPSRPAPRPQPAASQPQSPFAPYNPDMPEVDFVEAAPAPPVAPTPQSAPPSRPAPTPAYATPPVAPPRPATPAPATPPVVSAPLYEPESGESELESDEEYGEEAAGEEPAPWRSADWQPPVLPRFGPPAEQPRPDGQQGDH